LPRTIQRVPDLAAPAETLGWRPPSGSCYFYGAAYLMIGILVGALSSGFGIVRKYVKIWPINRQVIDWDKFEKMARGELRDASHSARPNSTPVVS
jgi:hypothetical protein